MLAYEEELRQQMVLSVIGAGVGGALFLITILILGAVTQICHWRQTKTKAKYEYFEYLASTPFSVGLILKPF